jgi:hypothetical protein
MTVHKAISMTTQGSPATLHKNGRQLRHKALLTSTSESGDCHTKYLALTEKAQAHFHQMGRLFLPIRRKADAA